MVVLEVTVFVEPVFFVVSSPQPTITPNPNSKVNARTFFIFSTSIRVLSLSAGTIPSFFLRFRGLGFYSRQCYNFFQIREIAGVEANKGISATPESMLLCDSSGFFLPWWE